MWFSKISLFFSSCSGGNFVQKIYKFFPNRKEIELKNQHCNCTFVGNFLWVVHFFHFHLVEKLHLYFFAYFFIFCLFLNQIFFLFCANFLQFLLLLLEVFFLIFDMLVVFETDLFSQIKKDFLPNATENEIWQIFSIFYRQPQQLRNAERVEKKNDNDDFFVLVLSWLLFYLISSLQKHWTDTFSPTQTLSLSLFDSRSLYTDTVPRENFPVFCLIFVSVLSMEFPSISMHMAKMKVLEVDGKTRRSIQSRKCCVEIACCQKFQKQQQQKQLV